MKTKGNRDHMDMKFGAKEEELRKEVQTFLKENIKADDDGGFVARSDEAFEQAKAPTSPATDRTTSTTSVASSSTAPTSKTPICG